MRRLNKDEPFWSFMLRNHSPGELQVMDVVSFFAIIIPCMLLAAGVCVIFPRINLLYPFFAIGIPGMYCWGMLAYRRGGKD